MDETKQVQNSAEISKKELLARYGISYGALYRWKRKGLIPEEWFIRRATDTGQETYFPEKPICERVEMILRTKDELSLDELAHRLKGEATRERTLTVLTVYGQRTFRAEDVDRVFIQVEGEEPLDLTELVKHGRK